MQNSSNEYLTDENPVKESKIQNKTKKCMDSNFKKVSFDSMDVTENQLRELRKNLPHIFTEGKINLERLKLVLGKEIAKEDVYSFNWAGRKECFKDIQTTAKETLRPNITESINFDSTENIFIEGENLEILKLLRKSYFNKIKMIYIDPPYNTGNDLLYTDDFKDSLHSYLEKTDQINEKGIKLTTNPETNGRFHSDWISMMYARLFITRDLLKNNGGLIFVSIDDNEVHNLRMIMNEIFDEENFVGQFVWRKKVGAGADSKLFFRQHEYILCYAKDKSSIKELYQPLTKEQKKEYSNPDNDTRGPWAPTDLSAPAHDNDPKRIYEVKSPTGKIFKKCWSYTKANFYKLIEDDLIWWGPQGKSLPKRKRFLKDKKGLTPRSLIDSFLTSDGRKDLKKIGMDKYFDYPKPVGLMKHLMKIASEADDIILDFFAGSGTTGQAVLELNQEQNSNRKFILIQIPEAFDERSEAYKDGYKTISDITKERIKRVINKLKTENEGKLIKNELDLGFKIFKLSQSNFKIWENYDGEDPNELIKQMRFFQNSLIEGCKKVDVIYECILKEGYNLNSKVETLDISSNRVYKIYDKDTYFYICLDYEINDEIVAELNLNKNTLFICLDEALNDNNKINLALQCNLKTI